MSPPCCRVARAIDGLRTLQQGVSGRHSTHPPRWCPRCRARHHVARRQSPASQALEGGGSVPRKDGRRPGLGCSTRRGGHGIARPPGHVEACFASHWMSGGFRPWLQPGLPADGAGDREAGAYLGITTLSITWITPFDAVMSVRVTLALSTFTPPMVEIVSSEP